ncbi:phosphoenolpyruvate carboxykinase [Rhodospirillaceae bacterium KN72]|uniref:Phosphoenolpyruvate carboxykinase (ATP) n=1 Tax=Pacificispira spongiicola TaxID=2729598 RepID=A0A7Y0E0D1_9PROT|nr:phosphoenolpyruvate carboxykinase [Pacificispira spongiicola]NMM44861.1 phosphoenolpyruvate carboxykinase [Pacificispira spongiicola]
MEEILGTEKLSTRSAFGLGTHGIVNSGPQYWNLGAEALYEATVRQGLGVVTKGGALACETGKYTGRSPNDKFILEEPNTKDSIWWGKVNKPVDQDRFDRLHAMTAVYLQNRDLYVQDLYAGADPAHRIKVRVVSESPWHALFARNMFIRPSVEDLADFVPDATILHAPYMNAVPERDGTNSECFVFCDLNQRLVLIGGTQYAGEIKKSVFSLMNYILPEKGVLPMHCSANIGANGDVAVFFGLSGTGKTTLSADGSRTLIGDDEHGWSDNGVFNFEGGCYAKVINLSQEAEPEIFATTRRFGTILENVVYDPYTREVDLFDGSLAENTRASYPIDFIPNVEPTGMGGLPQNIVMLTADAFGVLPPISELTPEQAMYHFLSGYTARVAGTERGVTEPQATFSTCFGAPFMPRHPTVYAKMLGEKMAKTGARCWLVNTGWSGGQYGVGKRMSIQYTRAMLRAAIEGKLASIGRVQDPNFGLLIPENCPDVPSDVLQPKTTWSDGSAYDATAHNLRGLFQSNFKQFESEVSDDIKQAGIYAA